MIQPDLAASRPVSTIESLAILLVVLLLHGVVALSLQLPAGTRVQVPVAVQPVMVELLLSQPVVQETPTTSLSPPAARTQVVASPSPPRTSFATARESVPDSTAAGAAPPAGAGPTQTTAPAAPVVAAVSTGASRETVSIAPPALPRIDLPSSDAAYLNNPKPAYPPLSRRMGEQGKVVTRVLISPEGLATQAELVTSSGYVRLDQAALATVRSWRYVPGKRNGVAEAMWFHVPVSFVLE